MEVVGILGLLVLCSAVSSNELVSKNASSRPAVLNIGAIFSFNSKVGSVAKVAIQAAVEDVNANSSVLGGSKLVVSMQDTNFSGFVGIMNALQFMAKDVIAVVGPQSDVLAHMVSLVANELQVPLLSFSATDPTLSSLQYPFFVRTSHSDLFQMSAVADFVDHYNWKNVVAIYTDDDHGRNGIAALGEKLAEKRCKISYKVGISPQYKPLNSSDLGRDEVTNILDGIALMESRIIIVHTYLNTGLIILSVAQKLSMMGNGYVWIATDWLSTVLDTSSVSEDNFSSMQGLITLRQHTADSKLKRDFVSRWRKMTIRWGAPDLKLNAYGLYAYDTVWMLARAIDAFFNDGGTISFSNDSRFNDLAGGKLNVGAMSIFDGGNLLLRKIYQTNLMGVTGLLKFDAGRYLARPAYDIINVIGTGSRIIGYWSNYSGLSILAPEILYMKPPNHSSSNQQLRTVIWPGDTTERPRGWVFPNYGKELRIGVPNRVSFRGFVSKVNGTNTMRGFCIDVFTAALSLLPYAVSYRFIPYGNGKNNPSYNELVSLVSSDEFDAAVGDIAIVTNRTKIADFTQPYAESGLVILAPMKKINSNEWAFLRPFTLELWCITALFFLVIGAVVWILEHRQNDEFRGPPKRQVVTLLCFSFSTMFFAHRENVVSTLGRVVLLVWLFVVLIIQSSYTASLTSILTVQKLSSPFTGLDSLVKSNLPIGYQVGSFAEYYLLEELSIPKSRLISLGRREDYATALQKGPDHGGVAAVVDELPYVQYFLARQCNFKIIGQAFTKNGWGFAFPRDSPLAADLSTAILQLSENGDLQRIHDKWLSRSSCNSENEEIDSNQLHLKSFVGLYFICGLVCLIALFTYFLLIVRQFNRYATDEIDPNGEGRSRSRRLLRFLTFADEKEETVKSRSKRRHMEDCSISSGRGQVEKTDDIQRGTSLSLC